MNIFRLRSYDGAMVKNALAKLFGYLKFPNNFRRKRLVRQATGLSNKSSETGVDRKYFPK
jgi:hypothetical protein